MTPQQNNSCETKEEKARKERLDFLKHEYEYYWDYYIKTLEERSRAFDIYFKIVTVPFGLVGGFIILIRTSLPKEDALHPGCPDYSKMLDQIKAITNGGALFFFMAALAGAFCFYYYSRESSNSTLYLNAVKNLRIELMEAHGVSRDLIPSEFVSFGKTGVRETLASIRFSRGMILAVLNSAFVFVGVWFWTGFDIPTYVDANHRLSTGLFFSVVILHGIAGILSNKNKDFTTKKKTPKVSA